MKTSPANLALIGIGLLLLAIGLLRAFPVQVTKQFLWNNVPPAVALILAIIVAINVGGKELVLNGIDGAMKTTSSFLVILVTLMPLISFGSLLTHYFEGSITGALKGPLGYIWATVSAFGAPGGSALSGSVTRLWSNPELRPLLLYFSSVVPLVSFTIYMVRKLGLSEEIAWTIYKTNWAIAAALAPCFWVYQRFFYRM